MDDREAMGSMEEEKVNEDIDGVLEFTKEIDKMKHIMRQSYLLDGSRRENDAEHSWHIATMALVFTRYAKEMVNTEHAVSLCVVHDLVEIYAGDTFAYDSEGYKTKSQREEDSAKRLFSLLGEKEANLLYSLWKEFEAGISPEAKYANCLDRLEPFLDNTLTKGSTWKEHSVTSAKVRERMQVVTEFLPALTPWVEKEIQEALLKGYLME